MQINKEKFSDKFDPELYEALKEQYSYRVQHKPRNEVWTDEEVKKWVTLIKEGISDLQIAKQLGTKSVRNCNKRRL